MTLRSNPNFIVPPGSIPSTEQYRPVVAPPKLVPTPQPTGSVGAPGLGPGYALSDHIHAGGSFSPSPGPPPPTAGDYSVLGQGGDAPGGIIASGSDAPMPSGLFPCTWQALVMGPSYGSNTYTLGFFGYGNHSSGTTAHLCSLAVYDGGSTTDGASVNFYGGAGFQAPVVLGLHALFDNIPHLITCTFDGASTIGVSLDGSFVGSVSPSYGPPDVELGDGFHVGQNAGNGITVGYPHYLDELQFYTYVLSADQISNTNASRVSFADWREQISALKPLVWLGFDQNAVNVPGTTLCPDYIGTLNLTYGPAGAATLGQPGLV